MRSEGICLITIIDPSREGGVRHVDVGQFYSDNYLIVAPSIWGKYGSIIQQQYPNRKYGCFRSTKESSR